MKTKTTILQQYRKYLEAIKDCDKTQLTTNYAKLMDFITKECKEEDYDFWLILYINCVYMTLKQVRARNIFLKEISEDWNPSNVDRFHKLLDKVCALREEGGDDYKICLGNLFKLILEQSDPSMQLYMHMRHENSIDGRNFYKKDSMLIKKLHQAVSDEEIDRILQESKETPPPTQHTSTRFSCTTPLSKKDYVEVLFKEFNPQTLEEAEECYAKLEDWATEGRICYDDYRYVKEILLSRNPKKYECKTQIKLENEQEAKNPKKKKTPSFQVIDGDAWEREYDRMQEEEFAMEML